MTRDINIQYACGCAKTAPADPVDWERAAQDGRVRIDRKFNRIGEYLETVYFDYTKCSKCRKDAQLITH